MQSHDSTLLSKEVHKDTFAQMLSNQAVREEESENWWLEGNPVESTRLRFHRKRRTPRRTSGQQKCSRLWKRAMIFFCVWLLYPSPVPANGRASETYTWDCRWLTFSPTSIELGSGKHLRWKGRRLQSKSWSDGRSCGRTYSSSHRPSPNARLHQYQPPNS